MKGDIKPNSRKLFSYKYQVNRQPVYSQLHTTINSN